MPQWSNPYSFPVNVQIEPGMTMIVGPGGSVIVPPSSSPLITPVTNTPTHNWGMPPTAPSAPSPVSGGSIDTESWDWANATTSSTLNQLINPLMAKKPMYELNPEEETEEFYNKRLSQVIQFKHGVYKGDIGLEIECEGTHLFNTPFSYWTCHADGSLRETAGHSPIEYVLKEPLSVTETKAALEYLRVKLKESGSKIVKSNRTSVHVHVNCQQMTVRELYCFICLYLIFEELLVDWSGPERAGNLFCLRAVDSNFYVGMLESVLKNKNFKQWREDYRYSACNVASITKFGSLEFRSMQGTVDVNEIQTWVEILMMLKHASLKYDNPIEIVEEFTGIGPLPFFKKIFIHDEFRKLFESLPGLSGKLWDGLRLMRDVAYTSEWKPAKKKTKTRKTKT